MKTIIGDILNLIFPRYCITCGDRLSRSEKMICVSCLAHLPRTWAHTSSPNKLEQLFWYHLPIERAAAFFSYDTAETRELIHRMKYHDTPDIGSELGRHFAKELTNTGFFDGIDLIIPVPLSRKRLSRRGYNQSEYIAKGISQVTGIRVDTSVIKRTVDNPSQTQKEFADRLENVRNIFSLCKSEAVKGKHVLIIDDVITSGATVTSCGKELVKAGDVRISVLSLAYADTLLISNNSEQQ